MYYYKNTVNFTKYIQFLFIILVMSTMHSCEWFSSNNAKEKISEPQEEPQYKYGIQVNIFDVIEDKLMRNKHITQMLIEAGISKTKAFELTQSCDSVFDVRKFKAGNPITMLYGNKDSLQTLQYFIYEISNTDYLVFDLRDSTNMRIYKESKPVEIVERRVKGVIETSLWNAMIDKGLTPSLAMEMSDIYAWTVDFFGLQKGDYFKLVYLEEQIDKKSVGVKEIKFALFNHQGKDYYAIPFEGKDGKMGYFDENGNGIKKAFLKAPLKFSRISSYFSNARMHPVIRIVRPHYGVDYAAPVGTPVMSIGNGTVIKKGYVGGAGNMVKIKHNATYTSSYMHLSKYANGIREGSRVSQGQVIGYVGSTGLSSGPHLDFRMYQNNKPINPLKVVSPPSEPIDKKRMSEYIHLRDSVIQVLKQIK